MSRSINRSLRISIEYYNWINTILQEIGGLRNEIEFLMNEEKRKKMVEKVKHLNHNLGSNERSFMINFLE
jgi:hypothetical protein